MANPVIIAQINPVFEPVAASATALVAASVIVTAILVPIITALYSRRMGGKVAQKNENDDVVELSH
ncbi:2-keto-3-deoxygluconate permease [compost metagenome]